MADLDTLERPQDEAPGITAASTAFAQSADAKGKKAPAPEAAGNDRNRDPNGPAWDDAQANAYLMNMRAWVDRANMLGGGHKDNVFGLRGAKLASVEHEVNLGVTALRAAFSRNPMQLLQGLFSMGMTVWKMELEKRNLTNYGAKVDGMGASIVAHHKLGIDMFESRDRAPRWSDGTEVRFRDFDRAMLGLASGATKVVPDGYTPTDRSTVPNRPTIPSDFRLV